MSKPTETQRCKRRKEKELRMRQDRAQKQGQPKLKAWEAPKMKLFQMPKLIRDDLSWEERLTLLRAVGDEAKVAFEDKYSNIQRWLTDYDPVYVLSMCAFYFSSFQEGTDPEAAGKLEFFSHYLEIMQAFALYQPRSLNLTALGADMDRLKSEMSEIGQVMSLRHLAIPEALTTEDEFNAYNLRTEMMIDTTAVRNWAYPHQMQRVVLDLAMAVHAEFLGKYRVDPVVFFTMMFRLADERNDLLNAHISRLRNVFGKKNHGKIVASYNDAFPENVPILKAAADELWDMAGRNKNALRSLLVSHADLMLKDIYSFSLDHALDLLGGGAGRDAVKDILARLSYRFGDLADFNRDHIILGNPVLSRPFIQLDDERYFTAVWGILPHLAFDLLEDLVWGDSALKSKYTRAKSKYLEDELERVIRSGFPNATLHRGSLWRDPATGVEYENDLLVVIDSFALVLEAKSASVSDPARRGAPERLAETLQELIEAPSDQAHRFINYLESHKQTHTFNTKRGVTNVIDSAVIKYYIPLGVTLSHLGAIGSNLKKLIKAGITHKRLEDLAPSISITDLESILELLPLEIEKIHYFARRREFEAHMEYDGDELDLLGFYLDTGYNVGQSEYDNSIALNMLMKSKELDPYFIASREGKLIPKPSLSMTSWWRDILTRISETRTEGWIETGFILLNTTIEDQEKFEHEFKALLRRVKCGEVDMPHNFVILKSGPDRRLYVIAGYPYTTTDKEVRNSVIADLIDSKFSAGVRGMAVIGVSLTFPSYPYSVLARRSATDLFDTLTF